jgi:hypothetical protein
MNFAVLTLVAATLCSGVLRADIIYSNFGADQSFTAGVGLTPAYSAVASSFMPDATYAVDEYQIAAYLDSPDLPDTVTFSLYNSVNNLPGTSLESFTLTDLGYPAGTDYAASTPPPGILTEASVSNPVVEAGQQYWIVMSGIDPGNVIWNDDGNETVGAATLGQDATWSLLPNYNQGAFEVDGTLVSGSSATPEPSSFLTLAGGLAGLALARKRRYLLKR